VASLDDYGYVEGNVGGTRHRLDRAKFSNPGRAKLQYVDACKPLIAKWRSGTNQIGRLVDHRADMDTVDRRRLVTSVVRPVAISTLRTQAEIMCCLVKAVTHHRVTR
jgi:hypothetical protein